MGHEGVSCCGAVYQEGDSQVHGEASMLSAVSYKVDNNRIIVNGIYAVVNVVRDKDELGNRLFSSHIFYSEDQSVTLMFDLNKRTNFLLTRRLKTKKQAQTIIQVSRRESMIHFNSGLLLYSKIRSDFIKGKMNFETKEEAAIAKDFFTKAFATLEESKIYSRDALCYNKFREFYYAGLENDFFFKPYQGLLKLNRNVYNEFGRLKRSHKKIVATEERKILLLGLISVLNTLVKNTDIVSNIVKKLTNPKLDLKNVDESEVGDLLFGLPKKDELKDTYRLLIEHKRGFKFLAKHKGTFFIEKLVAYDDERTIEDTVDSIIQILELGQEPDVKENNIKELHDSVSTQLGKISRSNLEIDYKENEIELEFFDQDRGISFELPADTYTLIDVGTEMGMCVGGYGPRAVAKKCIIVNVVKENKYVGCIELLPDRKSEFSLKQAKGRYNRPPGKDVCSSIIQWLDLNHVNGLSDCFDYTALKEKLKEKKEIKEVEVQPELNFMF